MGKVTGFMEIGRKMAPRRPVDERLKDWFQVYREPADSLVQSQGPAAWIAAFPSATPVVLWATSFRDWNDLVYRNRWQEAIQVLHKTNNFPEFTGWVCPAPAKRPACWESTTSRSPSSRSRSASSSNAFREGWIKPAPPSVRTGKRVAVVGSGSGRPGLCRPVEQGGPPGHRV